MENIKEAVENIKNFYGEALYSKDAGIVTKGVQTLLSLAQLFLSIKGVPKKKEFNDKFAITDKTPKEFRWDFRLENAKVITYNLCHDEYTAWLVGRVNVERIQEVILNNILKYDKGQELNVLGAATAIKTMIMGGRDG